MHRDNPEPNTTPNTYLNTPSPVHSVTPITSVVPITIVVKKAFAAPVAQPSHYSYGYRHSAPPRASTAAKVFAWLTDKEHAAIYTEAIDAFVAAPLVGSDLEVCVCVAWSTNT